MLANKPAAFYATIDPDELVSKLGSSLHTGLTDEKVKDRQEEYGRNVLTTKKELNIILDFLSHFKSPMIIILLIASIISFYLGERIDAIIIGVMIVLSVVIDFYLEHGAERAAEKLKEIVKTRVHVLRNKIKTEINLDEICVGDIIYLSAGSLVPADARVISAKDFFVNQSSLTGESFPAEKAAAKLASKDLSLTDINNIVFMGTNVVSGSATALVIKTGKNTEFGKIAQKLATAPLETEFDKGIKNFGYLIMKATIFLVLFIFLFNSIFKHNVPIIESFMFAVAVAVGLTPELLPMILSVTMAQGSLRMAKKGVIVKKLPSIPNFGSMDVLCTDKTGTLTEDKIRLVKYTDPLGNDSEDVLQYAYLNSFYQTGINNPLDEAVLAFREVSVKGFAKVDEIPFDFVRKKMSVVVESDGKFTIVTKGAPEELFKCAKHCVIDGRKRAFDEDMHEKIKKQYHFFSQQGYRVLAVAEKDIEKKSVYSTKDECDLTIIGFVSFLDPPKADVAEVIKEIHRAGIEVKIITGDNELVTKKICDEIGLNVKGILLGKEIDSLTDDALRVRVEKTTIFARFAPDEKNRVICALKANGHVVGYLGDGINDAPSLKTADIGISVNSAVDVAKESADIILTRKSLGELKEGVFEGRKTFANTLKYIMMGLSSNFGNMFSVAVAVIFLPFLPMLPIQILLNNFIYDFSQITIPSDNIDPEYIEKPKRWNMRFIRKYMFVFGPISSLFDILTFAVLWWILMVKLKLPYDVAVASFQTGWFLESLATQTLVIHIIRTKQRPFIESCASPQLLISSAVCILFGWILPYTALGRLFGLQVLPWFVMLSLAGIVVLYLVTVEIAKTIFYKNHHGI